MSQNRSFVWIKLLEIAWVSTHIGLDGVSGNCQGRHMVLTRLMETQIWCLPASACWVWGGLNKNNGLRQHLCLIEIYSTSPCPETRQFISTHYVTYAFQAAAPEMELIVSESISK